MLKISILLITLFLLVGCGNSKKPPQEDRDDTKITPVKKDNISTVKTEQDKKDVSEDSLEDSNKVQSKQSDTKKSTEKQKQNLVQKPSREDSNDTENILKKIDNNSTSKIDQSEDTLEEEQEGSNAKPSEKSDKIDNNISKFLCSANLLTEESFRDTFIDNNIGDMSLRTHKPGEKIETDVDKIEFMFNRAREKDPTISSKLIMPSSKKWNSFTDGQKMLYLINKERCDRGIRPYEGVSEVLTQKASQYYADFLADEGSFTLSHEADGKDPFERMEDAGVIFSGKDTNKDILLGKFVPLGEDLAAYFSFSSKEDFKNELPIAKSVYKWLYEDAYHNYGHRILILQRNAVDNSGIEGMEGVIGVGIKTKKELNDSGLYSIKTYVVLDVFDPKPNWENNLSDVTRVELRE